MATLNRIFLHHRRTVCSFHFKKDLIVIAPAVKQSNIFARISALLAISCMATGVGYSNPNTSASDDVSGSVLTVEIAKQYLSDADSVIQRAQFYKVTLFRLCPLLA